MISVALIGFGFNGFGQNSSDVKTLLGYLRVFPDDLGYFYEYPSSVIDAINRNRTYGISGWRLPTSEELSVLHSYGLQIGIRERGNYWFSDNGIYRKGTIYSDASFIRLVSTTDNVSSERREINRSVEGIEIGGVIWATRNVGNFGTFVANPEDNGSFYYGFEDPCPAGWRRPRRTEFENLVRSGSVWRAAT